ncbi:SDR family NAD(P)-dependent oxidoreductase [Nocardia jiangxiensis]|uniref:SDR family NAD(P)-dependent oxidoreductase n=1 Tax=Nocardia jiangxiensis TaxID=282685 RepID=UPI0002FB4103|nr:SDR family oxidoreductase [Nocardia jiangxiensis]
MRRLEGKEALVTGAGSGIGRETARRFAQEGAMVAVADRCADKVDATVESIVADGGKAIGIVVDVTNRLEVEHAVNDVVASRGGLDIVVNIAGVDIYGAAHELSEEDWDSELASNLKSVYLVSHAAWPHLKARGGGCILNTASVAALRAIADNAAYCVSKAGVIMLTQCMAQSGAPDNIRSNCISPGFTATGMIEGYFADQADPDAARAGALALHPLGRFGQTSDIAGGFAYLASDDAAWMTGSNLVIDGGLTSGM